MSESITSSGVAVLEVLVIDVVSLCVVTIVSIADLDVIVGLILSNGMDQST